MLLFIYRAFVLCKSCKNDIKAIKAEYSVIFQPYEKEGTTFENPDRVFYALQVITVRKHNLQNPSVTCIGGGKRLLLFIPRIHLKSVMWMKQI